MLSVASSSWVAKAFLVGLASCSDALIFSTDREDCMTAVAVVPNLNLVCPEICRTVDVCVSVVLVGPALEAVVKVATA